MNHQTQATAPPEWLGKIYMGADWGLFVGMGGETPLHSHLAFKLAIGLDSPMQIRDSKGHVRSGQVVAVRPNEQHQVLATGIRAGIYFADAGTFPDGIQLHQHEVRMLVSLCQNLADTPMTLSNLPPELLHPDHHEAADTRVTDAVNYLSQPDAHGLHDIAMRMGLSDSRLRHLFTAAVGGSPLRYRKWRRLWRAAQYIGAGDSITDAALEAGFSDAAHLSRTFVEMLGITPGMFQANDVMTADPHSHFIQDAQYQAV